MLALHILNVGHGSSIVVEFDGPNGRKFGVIDSNARAGQRPKALDKLQELGATRLAFVALTHPHKDHYRGLYEIVLAYKDKIDNFYTCPFGQLLQNEERLKALGVALKKVMNRSDGLEERLAALEFLQILIWATQSARSGSLDWHECKGEDFSIAPPDFTDIEISTVLPPSKVVGSYVERILSENASVLGHFDDNEISLAFRFFYRGQTVVLGGDGTVANWATRRKYEKNANKSLSGNAVNLPHHGSKYDCTPDVLEQLFSTQKKRYGISSANGHSHPDMDVIEWLERNSVNPFCTNLIPACGANAQKLLPLPGLEPEFARWIREIAITKDPQACQGDVVVKIENSGDLTVTPEFDHPCAFRGDYSRLFGV